MHDDAPRGRAPLPGCADRPEHDRAYRQIEIGIFGAEPWTEAMRREIEGKAGIDAVVVGAGLPLDLPDLAQDHPKVALIPMKAWASSSAANSRRATSIASAAITATAIAAIAPPAETFAKGRDFAAWLGLVPKQKLGAISRMGERTLRRLLIIGSSAVVLQASRRGAPKGSWLEGMLARKPRMLVTVALANKTARIVWAVLTKQEDYRAPVVVAT